MRSERECVWWLNCLCCTSGRANRRASQYEQNLGKNCPKTVIYVMYETKRCGQTGFLFWNEKQQVNPAKNLGELCRAEFEFNAICFDADGG